MSDLDVVVRYSQEIEAILATRYSAVGSGLQEKMNSVESQLPNEVISKIRKIGFIRNNAVHQLDYKIEDLDTYRDMCNFVIESLGGKVSRHRDLADRVERFGYITGLAGAIVGTIFGWQKSGIGTGIAIGIFVIFVVLVVTSRRALRFYRDTFFFLAGIALLLTVIYGAISLLQVIWPSAGKENIKTTTLLRK